MIFLNSASSSAASLVFDLPLRTLTDTEGLFGFIPIFAFRVTESFDALVEFSQFPDIHLGRLIDIRLLATYRKVEKKVWVEQALKRTLTSYSDRI